MAIKFYEESWTLTKATQEISAISLLTFVREQSHDKLGSKERR